MGLRCRMRDGWERQVVGESMWAMEKRDEGSCVGKMSPIPCFLGESHHQHFCSSNNAGAQGLPQLLRAGHWLGADAGWKKCSSPPAQNHHSKMVHHDSVLPWPLMTTDLPLEVYEGSSCLHSWEIFFSSAVRQSCSLLPASFS